MIRFNKLFLYLSVLVLFFSCEVSSEQKNNSNHQQDSTYIITTDSVLKSISDSIKIDSIQIVKVVFTDTTDYSKLKEEYKRTFKNKNRTLKIHSLKDTVNSINSKLDNIGERLKKCKL